MKNNTLEKAMQWISDIYHCSDIWGTTISKNDIYIILSETQKQKDPEEYSPCPELYKTLAAYWNKLAKLYPN